MTENTGRRDILSAESLQQRLAQLDEVIADARRWLKSAGAVLDIDGAETTFKEVLRLHQEVRQQALNTLKRDASWQDRTELLGQIKAAVSSIADLLELAAHLEAGQIALTTPVRTLRGSQARDSAVSELRARAEQPEPPLLPSPAGMPPAATLDYLFEQYEQELEVFETQLSSRFPALFLFLERVPRDGWNPPAGTGPTPPTTGTTPEGTQREHVIGANPPPPSDAGSVASPEVDVFEASHSVDDHDEPAIAPAAAVSTVRSPPAAPRTDSDGRPVPRTVPTEILRRIFSDDPETADRARDRLLGRTSGRKSTRHRDRWVEKHLRPEYEQRQLTPFPKQESPRVPHPLLNLALESSNADQDPRQNTVQPVPENDVSTAEQAPETIDTGDDSTISIDPEPARAVVRSELKPADPARDNLATPADPTASAPNPDPDHDDATASADVAPLHTPISEPGPVPSHQALHLNPDDDGPPAPPPYDSSLGSLTDVYWQLMSQQRFWTAALLADASRPEVRIPPGWLARACALAPRVLRADDRYSRQLREILRTADAAELLSHQTDGPQPSMWLAAAALLHPHLIDPSSYHELIADLVVDQVPALGLVREALMAHTVHQLPLDFDVLCNRDPEAAWKSRRAEIAGEIEDFINRAPQLRCRYQRATQVWRRMLDPQFGRVGKLLELARNDDLERLGEVRQFVAASREDIEEALQHEANALSTNSKRIVGRAREWFHDRIAEAKDHLQQWVTVHADRPEKSADYILQETASLRRMWMEEGLLYAAVEEADQLKSDQDPTTSKAAAAVSRTLRHLQARLMGEPNTTLPGHEDEELLSIPGLPHHEDGDLAFERREEVVRAVKDAIEPLAGAPLIQAHVRTNDFYTARRVLDRVYTTNPEADQIQQELEAAQRDAAAKLRADVEATLEEVQRLVGAGLDEAGRNHYVATLEAIDPDDTLVFDPPTRLLSRVRTELDQLRARQVEHLTERLTSADLSDPVMSRVQDALSNGDLLHAEAWLDAGPEAVGADEHDPHRIFAEYFPAFVARFDRGLGGKPIINHRDAEALFRGTPHPSSIDFSSAHEPVVDRAKSLFRAWADLRRTDTAHLRNAVPLFMRELGFEEVSLTRVQSDDDVRGMLWINTRPIRDRRVCMLPFFGSTSNGRYLVTVLKTWTPAIDIAECLGDRVDAPHIVLAPHGHMSVQERRDLMEEARERRQKILLLDESLLWFLAMQPSRRLAAFFRASLPFTDDSPYIVTGRVPPEMFYGRRRERGLIIDPNGSNLVYGGRQLGKTALLRDIAASQHAPDDGRVARWIDLKGEGIGTARPLDDIWVVIRQALKDAKVLDAARGKHTAIRQQVQRWLQESPSRSILLLLDEADTFLLKERGSRHGQDAGAFENLLKLKNIMESTNYRFKVVFAGLHNVQRTARSPNSPLAHLREPIQIGPLTGTELVEAIGLVVEPFAAMGFRFDPPDLPLRILHHANYYPSLTQLFCRHLLQHVSRDAGLRDNCSSGPPYVITSQHIDQTFDAPELRKSIVDRFMWTLDLDPRYRVLALAMALESIEDPTALSSGRGVDWYRDQAREWWQAGFDNDTLREDFVALLDEMVGLGVLRRLNDISGRYALRSPNILRFFGSEKEVSDALLATTEFPPPTEYDATHFRRTFDGGNPSPLTSAQEAVLLRPRHGIVLIFGLDVAGRSNIPSILEMLCAGGSQVHATMRIYPRANNTGGILQWLRDSRSSQGDGLDIALIPDSVPWDDAAVDAALEFIRPLDSTSQVHRRVVLLGSPQHALQLAASGSVEQMTGHPEVDVVVLRRWVSGEILRVFSEGTPIVAEQVDAVMQKTGGWHNEAKRMLKRLTYGQTELPAVLHSFTSDDALDSMCSELPAQTRAVLARLAQYGEPTPEEEMSVLFDEEHLRDLVDHIAVALATAEWLDLIHRHKHGFELDPFLAARLAAET